MKGFKGVIGMEHGNAKPGAEGEQAVIDAYRAADAFAR
jgi:hydroxypyruvate isomerase